MSRRIEDSWCGVIYGWFVVIGWAVMLGQWLKTYVRHMSSPLFWVLYAVCLVGLVFLAVKVPSAIAHVRKSRAICPHGLRGGNPNKRCERCTEDLEQQRQLLEEARQENERRKRIADSAANLRQEQLRIITEQRLRREDELRSLSPREFEDACSEMFRRLGYSVRQTPYSNDGGKDAVMTKDQRRYVAEFKRFARDKGIGRPHLQKFLAAMRDESADRGFFITTSYFADTAIAYARKNSIELVDAVKLVSMMREAFPDSDVLAVSAMCLNCGEVHAFGLDESAERTCACGQTVVCDVLGEPMSVRSILSMPSCERCGKPLRVVVGRGGKFWGCTGYPNCHFTKDFSAADAEQVGWSADA